MKISVHDIFCVVVIFIIFECILFLGFQQFVFGNSEKGYSDSISKIDLSEASLSEEENETLELINKYRRENGMADLKAITCLQNVSKLKAEDLVNSEYFSHHSPNLGTPFEMLKNNGINYKIAGENLAGNISPKNAVEAWINSESHRDNILDERFEYTGIYVIDSGIYGKVFVQLFIGI